MLELRAFRPADYPALAALQRACEPEHPLSEAHWRHEDGLDDPRTKHARVVAVAEGLPIAYAGYMQYSLMYHPRRFALYGGVAPAMRGRGVGRALYAWRGRGVALALKSRALADAKTRGFDRVCTRNAATNAGMLAVNSRLGYRPIAARLVMEKELVP